MGLLAKHDNQAQTKRIAIIGAGPSGLAALKILSDTPQFKAGSWQAIAFEAREALGGVWFTGPSTQEPPKTPLYDSLITNLPHPIMQYTSFPFPPSTDLYPPAATVLKYLQDYATHFDLERLIRFNTRVELIEWDNSASRWHVRTRTIGPDGSSKVETSDFDLVVIANGHYNLPYYPDIPGLSAWRAAGKVQHSAWYRRPEYNGDTVLVVGRGPSGSDIAEEMSTVSKVVIASQPGTPRSDSADGSSKLRGEVVEFLDVEEGVVRYADNTTDSGVDFVYLATGYEHTQPYLPPSILEKAIPPSVPPLPDKLYNSKFHIFPLAKHMFPLTRSIPPSSLAFLALPYRVIPFPLSEIQMRVVVKVLEDPTILDLAREAADVISRYEKLRAELGDSRELIARGWPWHKLDEQEQFNYEDELLDLIGERFNEWSEKVPEWVREIYPRKVVMRTEWRDIVSQGEGEAWVKGVGEAGGEAGLKQWIDLMRRLVERIDQKHTEAKQETAKVNGL
ncbi:FAD/NAD(P)-binding domain-containing protein [Irpex rosettiformis]|uniref:FAD/NAD(P)-binding domain-containing protein n=1 Tax=Irpex rosettiformis TaxID=378272 RepID=A0ACB8U1R0_9APHY|nr:FAD/NAD(P)-binding domain-containing protein [Irpex rosettiformis]